MRDWVKPFLLEEHNRILNELDMDEERKKFSTEHFLKRLENDEALYWDVADMLNAHFGFGLSGPNTWFKAAFGSVLSDLPKEVFLKLREMRNVFYTFTPNPGAEVKHFMLDETLDVSQWERIIVVTFPYDVYFMPPKATRGEIAHELAHLYLHGDKGMSDGEAMEDEADQIVVQWGMGKEIDAMRNHQKEYYEQEPAKKDAD